MCEQEQRLERMRMALAEAGYPDAVVWWGIEGCVVVSRAVPPDVIWRACVVCNETVHCLDCFLSNATGVGFIKVCEHPIPLL